MSVSADCEKGENLLAIKLDVTNGEYLVYEVAFKGAQALFTVVDQHGVIVMDPTDAISKSRFKCEWPAKKGDVKVPDDLNHVFSMSFVTAAEYDYVVIRRSKAGKKLEAVKNCTYASKVATDHPTSRCGSSRCDGRGDDHDTNQRANPHRRGPSRRICRARTRC